MALVEQPTILNKENIGNCESPRKKAKVDEMPSEKIFMKFAKLTKNAFTPTRGSVYAAGYDLYSAYEDTVPKHGKAVIKTDIQIAVPSGCYGRVAPRSGLAVKNFIDVGAGVIDQDYRGNVGVVMFNFSDTDFKVTPGARIAQLIIERIYTPELEECKTLDTTERGEKGYGSTGVELKKDDVTKPKATDKENTTDQVESVETNDVHMQTQ